MRIALSALAVAGITALPLAQADLVALYTFDDPANPYVDDSGNGNNLTDPGGVAIPTWGAAIGFGGTAGFDFDGGDRLIAPIDINPAAIPELTMGAWVRTDSLANGLRKVMGHDNGAWDRTLGLDDRTAAAGGGQVQPSLRYSAFTGTNNRGPLQDTPVPANTTDWTFLAVVYDQPNNTATLYVDLDASTDADSLEVVSGPAAMGPGQSTFSIGSLRPDNPNEGWDGAIDNAFILDHLATPQELEDIARRGPPAILGIPESDPAIAASPPVLFGDLTGLGAGPGLVMRTVTISNSGATQNLSITGIAISGPDAGLYTDTPGASTLLAPGESTDKEITFTPPEAGGTFEASLELSSNDPVRPLLSIPLNATVTSDPNIEVPSTLNPFGTIYVSGGASSIVREVVIRNTGVANTLTFTPLPLVTGADAANYSVSGPISIPPGEERAIEIILNPAGAALNTASLEINSDDPDAGTFTIPLDAEIIEVTQPANLLGFWCFDNEADPFEDLSGNENHITDALGPGGPTYGATVGLNGSGAYEFGGDGDRLIVPLDVNPATLPQMCWGAWVRTGSLAPGLRKVMGHDNGAWDRTIGLDTRNQSFRYTSFTGFQRPIEGSPGPVNTTDWTFLAANYDQDAQKVTVFVDLDASTTGDSLVAVSETGNFNTGWATFSIGSLRPDNDGEGWNGGIDNAFVYEGQLTTAQLEELRTRGKAFITGGATGPRLVVNRGPGGNLLFTWESKGGKLYNLRSEVPGAVPPDPGGLSADPIDWPIFGGNADLAATPPENTLSIPLPADPLRLFVIEEFNAPPVAVFSDDFESGQGGWMTGSDIDPGTDWELGTPVNVGPPAANSGANCFGTNISANYADSETSIWLRSPSIDLTTAGGATLCFHHWMDVEVMFDSAVVNILDASDDSVIATLDAFEGVVDPWEKVTLQIPAAALGKSIRIEFRFNSDDFNAIPQAGWYVDDVMVTVP